MDLQMDSVRKIMGTPGKALRLSLYTRAIFDVQGRRRVDENVLANFRTGRWLRVEAGFRQGERPGVADAYYHYKLELQSIYFWNFVRAFVRVSDNVINAPAPSYRKTNRLIVVDGKYAFTSWLRLNLGVGYLFSSRQDYIPDARPTLRGKQVNSPIFRAGLRYTFRKGSVEAVYGTYDVFNPYPVDQPFMQVVGELKLNNSCSLISYLRYQYDKALLTPANYFLCVGLQFYFPKDKP